MSVPSTVEKKDSPGTVNTFGKHLARVLRGVAENSTDRVTLRRAITDFDNFAVERIIYQGLPDELLATIGGAEPSAWEMAVRDASTIYASVFKQSHDPHRNGMVSDDPETLTPVANRRTLGAALYATSFRRGKTPATDTHTVKLINEVTRPGATRKAFVESVRRAAEIIADNRIGLDYVRLGRDLRTVYLGDRFTVFRNWSLGYTAGNRGIRSLATDPPCGTGGGNP